MARRSFGNLRKLPIGSIAYRDCKAFVDGLRAKGLAAGTAHVVGRNGPGRRSGAAAGLRPIRGFDGRSRRRAAPAGAGTRFRLSSSASVEKGPLVHNGGTVMICALAGFSGPARDANASRPPTVQIVNAFGTRTRIRLLLCSRDRRGRGLPRQLDNPVARQPRHMSPDIGPGIGPQTRRNPCRAGVPLVVGTGVDPVTFRFSGGRSAN